MSEDDLERSWTIQANSAVTRRNPCKTRVFGRPRTRTFGGVVPTYRVGEGTSCISLQQSIQRLRYLRNSPQLRAAGGRQGPIH